MASMRASSKKDNQLFTIDIKISGQVLSVPVFQGQNHETLIKRFCDQHLLKSDYKEAVKSKIIQALMTTIKKAEISSALKQKVNNFLNQKEASISMRSKTKSQKQIKNDGASSTPFKLLQSNNNSSEARNSGNRHVGGHLNGGEGDIKTLQNVNVVQHVKPTCIRKNKMDKQIKSKISNTINQSKHKINTPKSYDNDLIAAYQTIFRKSKQPHMKSMARKFLQQCGHFKTEQQAFNLNKKSSQPHSIFNKIHINSPKKSMEKGHSPSPNKNNQKMPINESAIHNLSKITQPFELSKQRESKQGLQSQHNSINIKKNSISYIRQAHLKYEDKYKNQVPDYSRYSSELHRSPYRSQKASISYQRLPQYNRPDLVYDQKLSYRYLNDPHVEREISLKRTRKYKYL